MWAHAISESSTEVEQVEHEVPETSALPSNLAYGP
jgi:hypothetical protein